MKKLFLLLAACLTSSAALAVETPADRCQNIADYSRAVAKMRDDGASLETIKAINHERAGAGYVDAYDLAASMTYKHANLSPEEVRAGMLKGCMDVVNNHK